ncbi:Vi polysaccharide biosynthesis protein VipA/TviB [Marinobacterium aestuarii]|uniref:Vi polysaccharide biosynthesis protein VipA/TviB n=1 Tax=Marinobacterium aestuarii TaxID=1821621 RepID=A0A1A9EWH2_9GAMM|nr:Vi polysaccharide biosynthesis UDP-N-acetylglucosamine C-6 dehydrogenase TviB [Marinobacterium aestuarii]ANG62494.1 Vi polysaccharide biosynthesis protein VipA/TviB [Marinobacterium aestuarii]
MNRIEDVKVAVIGLGYVGLPLAAAFAKKFDVVGFDIDAERINALKDQIDSTLEMSVEELGALPALSFSSDPEDIRGCQVYIVTVPTPIDRHKRPDLGPLQRASELLSGLIQQGDVVIYESTVYPGATEEVCVPLLEKGSGFTLNEGFFVGYSPERINPGDKDHRVADILKVTSGSTDSIAEFVDTLYKNVIAAGTYKASSIRVAEAAKAIENTQRDINIALINELAMIFKRLDIDTEEVLRAAGTKWNFLPFRPGLVGGHCIGVDPYYMTHKAQEVGYHPEMILAGRRINDAMGRYVAGELVKGMLQRGIKVTGGRVLVMGLTFKENCPDIRNTKVVDILTELETYGVRADVYDPWVDAEEAQRSYGISPLQELEAGVYDGIILAVAHEQFVDMGATRIRELGKPEHLLYDLKYVLLAGDSDMRL